MPDQLTPEEEAARDELVRLMSIRFSRSIDDIMTEFAPLSRLRNMTLHGVAKALGMAFATCGYEEIHAETGTPQHASDADVHLLVKVLSSFSSGYAGQLQAFRDPAGPRTLGPDNETTLQ